MQDFLDFLAAHNMPPAEPLKFEDGKLGRFRIQGDKAGSKNGRYQLWVQPDGFASGWAKNMREGITHNYVKQSNRILSDAERREWARKKKEQDDRRAKEEQDKHQKAASTSKYIFDKAEYADNFPYVEKKGLTGTKVKIYKGAMIVPAYKNAHIIGMQFITEDGTKRFKSGADMKGAYGAQGTDKRKIYISEGWATAQSISLAVAPFVCVWAFNSGNLLNVAVYIREKFPDAEIIICSDNDQWSKLADGTPYNAGRVKGQEAAAKIKCAEIYPDFPADMPEQYTDFNDYHQVYGIEQLRTRLSQATAAGGEVITDIGEQPDVVGVVTYDGFSPKFSDDWKANLICKENGALVKGSLKNVILILENHPSYAGIFRLNEFQKEIYVHRAPPWENLDDFEVRRLNDNDITSCTAAIETIGLSSDNTKTMNAIKVISEKNGFHPAREYFNQLVWDGEKRLERWLSYYMGAEDDDPEYLAFIGKKWLTASVKRIFEPGCKFDHVLVAEGKQGKGKSTAFEYLATFGTDKTESYFTDSIKISDIQNKDTILLLQGSLIVELAELSGFNKKDDDEIKGWITKKFDKCRLPYGRTITDFPRQFVLCGTTNNYDYLKDPTGNRRYWPFKATSIDLPAIQRDREQLWAEAVHYYKTGLYIGPEPEEMELAKIAQDKRLAIDPLTETVMDAYEKCAEYTSTVKTSDIIREMNLTTKDMIDSRLDIKISKIMRQNGYENKSHNVKGKTMRVWVRND